MIVSFFLWSETLPSPGGHHDGVWCVMSRSFVHSELTSEVLLTRQLGNTSQVIAIATIKLRLVTPREGRGEAADGCNMYSACKALIYQLSIHGIILDLGRSAASAS